MSENINKNCQYEQNESENVDKNEQHEKLNQKISI
jgi:hypothetical protein